MALDINGYNATFKAFADYAQQRVDAHAPKTVIDAETMRTFGGRTILAVSRSHTDKVHNWMRTNDQQIANDRTRELFKNAIIDMFGGESKIMYHKTK